MDSELQMPGWGNVWTQPIINRVNMLATGVRTQIGVKVFGPTGKPLTEGGLRLGYTWDYGKYDVAIYGRNITDEVQVVGGIDFNNLTGFINEPRLFGAEFKASF